MLTIRPAKASDVARLAAWLLPLDARATIAQIALAPAWAVEDGDRLIAVAGLWPAGGGVAEFWMRVVPGLRGTGAGPRLMRLLRRHMLSLPAGTRLRTCVRRGHETGCRMARLLGFHEAGELAGGRLLRFETVL